MDRIAQGPSHPLSVAHASSSSRFLSEGTVSRGLGTIPAAGMSHAVGLSQTELARASGVPLRTITNLEQGIARKPKLVTAMKLAKALKPLWFAPAPLKLCATC